MFLVFVQYFKYAVILKVIVHWIIMFLWIRRQGMQFYKSRCQQLFFNVALTTTYLFCYVDLTNDYDENNYCFYMVVRMVECLVTLIWTLFTDVSVYYLVTLIMWVFTNWILHMLVHYAVHGNNIGWIRCLVSIVGLLSVCFTVFFLLFGVYIPWLTEAHVSETFTTFPKKPKTNSSPFNKKFFDSGQPTKYTVVKVHHYHHCAIFLLTPDRR